MDIMGDQERCGYLSRIESSSCHAIRCLIATWLHPGPSALAYITGKKAIYMTSTPVYSEGVCIPRKS